MAITFVNIRKEENIISETDYDKVKEQLESLLKPFPNATFLCFDLNTGRSVTTHFAMDILTHEMNYIRETAPDKLDYRITLINTKSPRNNK